MSDTTRSHVSLGRAAAPDLPAATVTPGARVGRYEIERRLGAGGMGVVWLAFDPELARPVAIKQLASHRDDWEWHARLLREAQAMARLKHPNVVTVFDVGLTAHGPFVAMEYVEGTTLRSWLREPRPRRAIMVTFVAAARGLAAAHRAGLVHRDFKPDNVLIGRDGRVCVTDFGLVQLRAGDDGTPSATGGMGTPGYMAPEQYRGDPVDARADQFSFACALYEALYERRPHAGETADEVRRAVLAGTIELAPGTVPGWLRRPLLRALALAPADRFPTMDALIEALQADPAIARRRRRRWIGAGAAIPALTGAAVYLLTRPHAPVVIDREDPAALDTPGCAGAEPNARLETSGPTGYLLTPTNYKHPSCYKAFVVGVSLPPSYDLEVRWADPWPRTEEQCVGAYIAMKIHGADHDDGPYVARSRWRDGKCHYGRLAWSGRMFAADRITGAEENHEIESYRGEEVRLVITARTPRGSTQPIEVTYALP